MTLQGYQLLGEGRDMEPTAEHRALLQHASAALAGPSAGLTQRLPGQLCPFCAPALRRVELWLCSGPGLAFFCPSSERTEEGWGRRATLGP